MSKQSPIGIHVTTAGGLLQRVYCEIPANVIVVQYDSDRKPVLWESGPLELPELVELLDEMGKPYRVVAE